MVTCIRVLKRKEKAAVASKNDYSFNSTLLYIGVKTKKEPSLKTHRTLFLFEQKKLKVI
jgi:hypothetical protein